MNNLVNWPWGHEHIALNGMTFVLCMFLGIIILASPVYKLIAWYCGLWS